MYAQNFFCTWCNEPPPTPITRVQFLIPSLIGLRLVWFNSILMQIWDTIIYNEWLGSVERRRFYIFPSLSNLRLLSYSIKMYVIHDQNFVLWWIPYYFNGLDFYTNQVSCRIVDTIIFVLFSISIFDYFKFKASENKQYCYILKWKIICVLWFLGSAQKVSCVYSFELEMIYSFLRAPWKTHNWFYAIVLWSSIIQRVRQY